MATLNLDSKNLSIESGVFKIVENEFVTFKCDTTFNENSEFSELYESHEEFLREFVFSNPDEHDLNLSELEQAVAFILENSKQITG